MKKIHWTLVIPLLTLVVGVLLWLFLSFAPSASQHIRSLASSVAVPMSGWPLMIIAILVAISAIALYCYIDYKQHTHARSPDEVPKPYRVARHAKVAVLPKVLQNWEKGVYWILHGMASIVVLSILLAMHVKPALAYGPNDFVTTWKTDNPGDAVEFVITGSTYSIDWGDGTVTSELDSTTHTYTAAGDYTVIISGDPFDFRVNGDADRLLTVEQWGNNPWSTMEDMFNNAVNVQIEATDVPDLSAVTTMEDMFFNATSFNSNINNWDVSNVTNMEAMFSRVEAFNQPLNNWDTSNVTTMKDMFAQAIAFNQTIDAWDVSSVTNMENMFSTAWSFNQPLNNWDVSSVSNMSAMFHGAVVFNQPLNNWDTSSVTNMTSMLSGTWAFNQSIDSWDTSNVTNMSSMFSGTRDFNQPLNSWDTSSVANMNSMFNEATSFNQPLNNWDVSSVADMSVMFGYEHTNGQAPYVTVFNQDISSWDVSSVTDMEGMFQANINFNQSLNSWDVSNVTNMETMFAFTTSFDQSLSNWDTASVTTMFGMFYGATSFNSNISNWDVSHVTNMSAMFLGASGFDQSLASWDVSSVTTMLHMFGDYNGLLSTSSGLSAANYEATLASWAGQSLQSNITFNGGTSTYCGAESIRQTIITTFNWTIADGGVDCGQPQADANKKPSVTLLAPAEGDSYAIGQTVELAADAQDEDGQVASVRFYVDGYLVGTDTAAPFQLQKQDGFPEGRHDAFAIAVDNSGAVTTSEHVTFTVGEPPESAVVADKTNIIEVANRVASNQQNPAYSNNVTYYAITGPAAVILQSLPWILLLLLALFYLIQAWRQYRQNQLLQYQLAIAKQTQTSLDSFLSIVSHYLRTPVTIMAGATELAGRKVRGAAALITTIKELQAYVGTVIDKLTTQAQAIKETTSSSKDVQSYSMKYWVIAPSVGAIVLALVAVLGLARIGVWEAGLDRVVFSITLTLGSVVGTFLFFRLWQRQRSIGHTLTSALRAAEASLDIRRNVMLESLASLVQYENKLADLAAPIKQATFQKTFTSGFNQFKRLVETFSVVEQVTTQPVSAATTRLKSDSLTSNLTPLQQKATTAGINLQFSMPAQLVSPVSSNELQYVLHSLIDNAITFTPQGGQIDVIVERAKKADLTIMVTDTGAGIVQDKLDTLLQPFGRGTDTGVYNYQGMGLSLYVTRLIAERYGGTVTIGSEVGKGTTVCFMVKSKHS